MYSLVRDLNSINIDKDSYVYVDTETIGLYGDIRIVQIYQSKWDKVAIVDTKDIPLVDIYNFLKNHSLVFHNGHYDMSCFSKALKLKGDVFADFEDTFLLGKLAFPHLESFSLDSMFEEVLGCNPYVTMFEDNKDKLHLVLKGKDLLDQDIVEKAKSKMQKAKWDSELTELHYLYASLDVYYLPKLFAECIKHLQDKGYILDKKSVDLMLKFQEFGLPVNKEKFDLECAKISADIHYYTSVLPEGLNVNSSKQVCNLLNTPSADDLQLAELISEGSELAKNIRECKSLNNRMSFLDNKFNSDRVYGYFNVTTKSGRSSCSEQNLQQIPSKLKHIFESDKFLVYADFSNLELRTFAGMVGELVMKTKFDNNEDLHTFSASKLFNKPVSAVDKTERQIAKTFNFSSLYGAGVSKRLQILLKNTGIKLSEDKGRELAKNWLSAFPQVKGWHNDNYKKWEAGIIGYTALGRPYKAKLYTDFGNLMVQGTGAEVSKIALLKLAERIDIRRLCVFIHDSYTFECDTLEQAKFYAETLALCMQEAWNEVRPYFKLDVGMPVDAVVGKNWKDLQNDENLIYKFSLN